MSRLLTPRFFQPLSHHHTTITRVTVNIFFLAAVIFFSGCHQKQASKEKNVSSTKKEAIDPVVIAVQSERDTLKGSLKAIATGRIKNTFITVLYHSPAVRGRVVWGGLVPFDQVWVTGAHMATSIEFEGTATIGEQELPAGKYGLFTIPSQEEWTVVINKNWDQHLTDEYREEDDIVRIQVKPNTLLENQERLMYSFQESTLTVSWEKISVAIPISVD
jgi:hypothetical protein